LLGSDSSFQHQRLLFQNKAPLLILEREGEKYSSLFFRIYFPQGYMNHTDGF